MTEQELHEKLTDILQMKLQELPLKPQKSDKNRSFKNEQRRIKR